VAYTGGMPLSLELPDENSPILDGRLGLTIGHASRTSIKGSGTRAETEDEDRPPEHDLLTSEQ
jgi:hypothetical protein